MPTQAIRDLQLNEGDREAYLDLSNRQSQQIGENIPSSNFSQALQGLMTKYSQPYYQSREATLGLEQEQAKRGYQELPESVKSLELSPSQQREFRGAGQRELRPTISGREERERVYLGQFENLSKFLTNQLKAIEDEKKEARRAPQTRSVGGRLFQWSPDARKWEDTGISGGEDSGGGTFTKTQKNKGAATAGIPLADFEKIDSDTKNFFINRGSEVEQKKKEIQNAKTSGEDPKILEKEISESNAPPSVKDTLIRYLKEVFKEEYRRFGQPERRKIFGIF